MNSIINIGIDIGSTTIKAIAMREGEVVYSTYNRHYSDIRTKSKELIHDLVSTFSGQMCTVKVTGSSGLFISDRLGIEFIQEVIASTKALENNYPEVDVAIELGGEDAKITYFGASLDQRMNGVCAGGTGAFVDQMATLLNTTSSGLNDLAKNYNNIFPIASRCGVFAKSDIQPLLNEGVAKEDIAVSVLQAVVNQTISGLACGKPIRGKVAFLGGPLHFLSELRERFIETLGMKEEDVIYPELSHYYVAMGAALDSATLEHITAEKLMDNLYKLDEVDGDKNGSLKTLFKDNADYMNFRKRHERSKVKRGNINDYKGPVFLGIDAGSTTTKIVAIGSDSQVLYEYYGGNLGNPLNSALEQLMVFYERINKDTYIARSAVTGYGEHLLKAALNIDMGEIETVAHYTGADHFLKDVDFVIDIGGQDMKSLKIKDGYIESIMLNEACSSGCGSFIETFSKSLGLTVEEFVKKGIESRNPVDLGTRCTVFMNSRVKQAQKEGASVGDISAGISYSVIKNALYKVIRIKNVEELGNNIVVQGGTFYNDVVLRAFEEITGKEVVRPDIAGVMGAFGCALLAKKSHISGERSSIISKDQIAEFTIETENKRCQICGNNCMISINKFNEGRVFISGNRCERGSGVFQEKKEIPNIYDYKYKRVFSYKPLSKSEAPKGEIGIPRVLNVYENYPLWFTVFTELGYRVVLSPRSTREIFNKGMESIPSESACYPAKIVHGHIESLIENGIKKIFYPSIPYEIKENEKSDNHFNCPIVTSYPETIRCNLDNIHSKSIEFINPFLPIWDKVKMKKVFYKHFESMGHSKSEIDKAIDKGYDELNTYKSDVRKKGEEVIAHIEKEGIKGIVLAGRPYHIDPEINHGIPAMISGFGVAVLSEDSISHLDPIDRPLRVVDQWAYHSRLYDAANYTSRNKLLQFVQLNSFGCGLDAVTTDQVNEILAQGNKSSTLLKIDEINNLGAARIRIRSLLAVMSSKTETEQKIKKYSTRRIEFTKRMKKEHTILCPQMSPIHFDIIKEAFHYGGYNFKLLENVDGTDIDEGLKVVNNDACYPSIIVVGQLIGALKSGDYDLNNTSVLISQTGGGCRATNYIGFIRKALTDTGFEEIPVISFNAGGLEKNSGFKMDVHMLKRLCMGLIYGDLLMRVLYKVRPYELIKGSANGLYSKWNRVCKDSVHRGSYREFVANIRDIVKDFDELPTVNIVKPKVGIVGEILVKFHPQANNQIVEQLEREGVEVVVPDLTDFLLYSSYNTTIRKDMLSASTLKKIGGDLAIAYIEFYRKEMKKALLSSERFNPPKPIQKLAEGASKIISLGHQTGEGWFLTAEIVELLEEGVNNIACLQPFACLPNHITGKGVIKELKKHFPLANIAPIDYDPGASEVNQINRIKLMLSTANKNL